MKTTAVLVAALVVGTTGFLIKVPTAPTIGPGLRPGPVGWVHLQKLILPLFENVCEDSVDPVIVRLAQEFTLDFADGEYMKTEVITNLKNLKVKGLLPKGEIFTDYNLDHIKELKIIYDVMVYSKNFDTFLKAASWARQNVNCGLFIRAIYLTILNRRDTEKISVPAPYELFPNYFIQEDVIVKASALLSGEEIEITNNVHDDGNSYVLDAEYTAQIINNDEDSKLAYFHEDIGLNTFYFLQKLKRSSWFNTSFDVDDRRGEYLYHMMKQLAARYSLERYANDLSDAESFTFDKSAVVPYDPMLVYSNGNEFGHRTSYMDVTKTNADELSLIENTIASVVTTMRDTGCNKTQIINRLMDILFTGEQSYETVLRKSMGKDSTFTSSQPSVLEHYMTSLRDPVFWRINKKIVNLVDDTLKEIPVYTRNELYFPGVEVLNIDVKKMMTNFNLFQFDVSDALKSGAIKSAFQVKISQQRLDHKPLVVKMNISSLVTQKGLIKIYLGPKMAPGEMFLKKNLFMLLDSFECNFKVGSNIVSRSSTDMTNLSDDFTSLNTFRKNIEDAEFGLDVLPFKGLEGIIGFPQRLILPKGSPDGLPLQIFVFVAPFVKSSFGSVSSKFNAEFNSVILSPGYPLDLNMYDNQIFNLPNAMVKDVFVVHKSEKASKYGSDTGKEPFDYSAKKGQYGKKEGSFQQKPDYTTKIQYNSENSNTEKIEDILTTFKSEMADDIPTEKIKLDYDKFHYQIDNDINNENTINNYSYLKPEHAALKREPYGNIAKKVKYSKKQEDYATKREYYKKMSNDKKIGEVTTTPNPNIVDKILQEKINMDYDTSDYQNNIDLTEQNTLRYKPSVKPEYAAFTKEPLNYTAKNGEFGNKDGTNKKQEDFSTKREYYKKKSDTTRKTDDIKPDIIYEIPLEVTNLDYDKFDSQINHDLSKQVNDKKNPNLVKVTLIQDSDKREPSFESDTRTSSPKLNKPTIFDLIAHPYAYYFDIKNEDDKVYE